MHYPFNTNGSRGSAQIPQEVHNKIGKILYKWLAEKGKKVERNSMIIYIEGHVYTEDKEKGA
jgi:hypothetical protein